MTGAKPRERQRTSNEESVLYVMTEPMTAPRICAHTGLTESQVRLALNMLVAEGLVVQQRVKNIFTYRKVQ